MIEANGLSVPTDVSGVLQLGGLRDGHAVRALCEEHRRRGTARARTDRARQAPPSGAATRRRSGPAARGSGRRDPGRQGRLPGARPRVLPNLAGAAPADGSAPPRGSAPSRALVTARHDVRSVAITRGGTTLDVSVGGVGGRPPGEWSTTGTWPARGINGRRRPHLGPDLKRDNVRVLACRGRFGRRRLYLGAGTAPSRGQPLLPNEPEPVPRAAAQGLRDTAPGASTRALRLPAPNRQLRALRTQLRGRRRHAGSPHRPGRHPQGA